MPVTLLLHGAVALFCPSIPKHCAAAMTAGRWSKTTMMEMMSNVVERRRLNILDHPSRYFAVVKDKWRRTEQKSGFRVNKLVDINFRKSVAFPNSVLVRRKRREEKKRRFWRKGQDHSRDRGTEKLMCRWPLHENATGMKSLKSLYKSQWPRYFGFDKVCRSASCCAPDVFTLSITKGGP